jgi:hypothetical protein
MTELFKCRYCKHSHNYKQLAGALSNQREIQTALDNIEAYEGKLADLVLNTEISEERKKYKEEKWDKLIKDWNAELKEFSNVMVCSFCWAKAKTAANIDKGDAEGGPFNCDNCQNRRDGRRYGLHIGNQRGSGIDPRKWSIVCQDCYDNQVVPADYVCPRTSEGRSDWDIEIAKYDCLCPRPESTRYLTINSETIIEIVKGTSPLKPKKKPTEAIKWPQPRK